MRNQHEPNVPGRHRHPGWKGRVRVSGGLGIRLAVPIANLFSTTGMSPCTAQSKRCENQAPIWDRVSSRFEVFQRFGPTGLQPFMITPQPASLIPHGRAAEIFLPTQAQPKRFPSATAGPTLPKSSTGMRWPLGFADYPFSFNFFDIHVGGYTVIRGSRQIAKSTTFSCRQQMVARMLPGFRSLYITPRRDQLQTYQNKVQGPGEGEPLLPEELDAAPKPRLQRVRQRIGCRNGLRPHI